MIFACCSENRRAAVLSNPSLKLNGIDYLEVLDYNTLVVHCLWPLSVAPATALTPANVVIDGGESITGIAALWVSPASPAPPLATATEQAYFAGLADAANVLVVRTTQTGDFSPYTLRLVNDAVKAGQDPFDITAALSGFDPQLAQVEFSFRVGCGPDFDCALQPIRCPLPGTPPPINYLAKDYGSFRSVLLDRMNQLLPGWGATTEADLGIALAELIAYVGDQLSYRQDAVATEAYLETARSRVSLRRHALLVDYRVHDGCNARAWVQFKPRADSPQVFLDRNHAVVANIVPGAPAVLANNEEAALAAGAQLFEPMHDALLFLEHNQIFFYTWGETDCCLPAGSTEATLAGTFPNLRIGDVLIFQEVKGPRTGVAADADIRHRCAVRLTQVATVDSLGHTLVDPVFGASPVTEIQWSSGDALPFPVCLSSSFLDSNGNLQSVTGVSVALGNMVLVDHGLSASGIDLGSVPAPRLFYASDPSADRCAPSAPVPIPVRFRPSLQESPVTQAVPLPLAPLAGLPVTPAAVMLNPYSAVSLVDSGGIFSLLVQPASLPQWLENFGVVVRADSNNFDLEVVYNTVVPVVVESFTGLSLNRSDPNYAPTQINLLSKLISVPSSYVPPSNPPSGYSTMPAQIPNTGTMNLVDTAGAQYLTIQPSDPGAWAPLFGVIAQGNQQNSGQFNFAVVYNPSSGGVGVNLPVAVEQFKNISLATVSEQVSAISRLISVRFVTAASASLSANDLMHYDAGDGVPVIGLEGTLNGMTTVWTARQDLLEGDANSPNFVVEVESNGAATLRFGDDVNGKNPEAATSFSASYRIGNGTAGNLGAENLVVIATEAPIDSVINPLPACGGVDPETNEQIRRRAPQAFLTLDRAVTMPDYEALAESNSQVSQAIATLRWTGSWYTVFVGAEPHGGGNLSPALEKNLKTSLERYRLAGQDLQLQSPQYVSLEIELRVSVNPNYFQSHVEQSLLAVLGNGVLPNGQKGLFYPDSFTLGQAVYLSPIYAAVRSVAGVLSVTATKFQPQGVNSPRYLSAGTIKLGPFQVARLENDPSFPDHGTLTLVMRGGK